MASQYPLDIKSLAAPGPSLQHPNPTDQSHPTSSGHTPGRLRGFLSGGLLCAAAVYSLRGLGSSYLLPAALLKNGETLPGRVQDEAEEGKFDWSKVNSLVILFIVTLVVCSRGKYDAWLATQIC